MSFLVIKKYINNGHSLLQKVFGFYDKSSIYDDF